MNSKDYIIDNNGNVMREYAPVVWSWECWLGEKEVKGVLRKFNGKWEVWKDDKTRFGETGGINWTVYFPINLEIDDNISSLYLDGVNNESS